MNAITIITAGSLAAAALLAPPEQPRAALTFPAHVNDVVAADQLRVSVEFSVLIQVIDGPKTKGAMIRSVAGKPVMLEIPLYDDLSKSIGPNGIRARVRKDRE